MPLSRRTFLTTGGVAALALAVCGGAWRYTHPAPATAFVLTDAAGAILDAIIPAMLAGALTDKAAIPATRARVVSAIHGLPLTAQDEIQGLFRLLALGPVRRFLAGVPADWRQAAPEQVSAFLQSWESAPLRRFAGGLRRAARFDPGRLVRRAVQLGGDRLSGAAAGVDSMSPYL